MLKAPTTFVKGKGNSKGWIGRLLIDQENRNSNGDRGKLDMIRVH